MAATGAPTDREPVARDRNRARALVEERGHTATTIEQVARQAFGPVPIARLDRARALLRRFFSSEPWRIEDESALASMVGPGTGWQSLPVDDELTVEFGWKGGAFRIEADGVAHAPERAAREPAGGPAPDGSGRAAAAATLATTFDLAVVPEAQHDPRVVNFLTGAGTGGSGRWQVAGDAGNEPRVRDLCAEFGEITRMQLGNGLVAVEVGDVHAWPALLLPLIEAIVARFTAARPVAVVDRALERARAELDALSPASPRDLLKITEAARSRDAALRRLAVAKLVDADPITALGVWKISIDDQARDVRRATVIAIAHAARNELRPLLEAALRESDACARFHAVVGLARIGLGRSEPAVVPLARDPDARVRVAVAEALRGVALPLAA